MVSTEYGEYTRQIIEEYNREMKLEDLGNVNVAKRYIMLRKILDRVIEQHGGEANVFKEERNKAEIKVIKSEYSAPIRKVETFRAKVQESQRGVLRKKDRQKKEEKASSPAKKAGGAKKKAAGKKADKKAGGSKPKKDKKKENKKEEKKDDKKKYGVGKGLKEIAAVADLILQTAKNVGEVLGRAKTPKIEVVGVPEKLKVADQNKEEALDFLMDAGSGFGEKQLENSTVVNENKVEEVTKQGAGVELVNDAGNTSPIEDIIELGL